HVGLTPQLVEFDALRGAGLSIGQNWTLPGGNLVTAAPGKTVNYRWYAGKTTPGAYPDAKSKLKKLFAEPVEYGAINLMPSDRMKQISKGAIGALIIEPQGAKWQEDAAMRASATVTLANGKFFREHVLLFQDDLNLQQDGVPVPNLAGIEDPEDTAQKGFNYRTEPLWTRMGFAADTPLEITRTFDFTNVLTGAAETPTFLAKAGEPVRMRVLQAGGHSRNHVFQQHGHIWLEEPFTNGSTVIGTNSFSEWHGSQAGIGPGSHFNFLLAN
ncbi:copper oxidase, partial [Methylobacter sp. BlB1]|nr:copper oxidase [Methylobacter sp. BlB1]